MLECWKIGNAYIWNSTLWNILKGEINLKELSEATKYRIADLYQNTRMSISVIAQILEISTFSVNKYKDLEIPVQRRIV